MPTKRLTSAMVERIKPPAAGQVEYWDRNMPGLALRVSYRGTKAWTVLTRLYGKVIRVTLGEWPTMGLAEAHTQAREAKRQAKTGIDPREQKQQQQTEAEDARKRTFEGMADLFLERYAKPKLRERTVVEYTRALKGGRTKPWEKRPIASISRRDVMDLLDGLEAEGKHATAKLTLAYLRKFFGWCAERDAIKELPTYRVRLNGSVKARERALSPIELRQVWSAAGKIGGAGGALVKLLILTGQRRYETSMMRWSELSGLGNGAATWSIPGEVTKNGRPHDVPLAPEAVAVIRSRPIITVKTDKGESKSELVFTTTGKAPWSGFSKLKRQIDEKIAEDGGEPMAPWTYHDLRRSLVTGLNENAIAKPHIIEAIVNHISGHRGGIAGIYNRAVYMDERRRALEAWAKLIVDPTAASGKVVQLRSGTNGVEPATA